MTKYRIIDLNDCGQILANAIPDLAQAQKLLELLARDYPEAEFAIEAYTYKD